MTALTESVRRLRQAARRVPGYRVARRGALKVLASPQAGQGLARRIYPDLVSRSEMSAAVATAQTKGAAQLARAQQRHERNVVQAEADQVQARKALKAEHQRAMTAERARLRDKRTAAVTAERQKGREARIAAVGAERQKGREARIAAVGAERQKGREARIAAVGAERQRGKEARDQAVATQRLKGKEKRIRALADARQNWNDKHRTEQESRLPISAGVLIAGESLALRPLIVCDVRGLPRDLAADVLDEVAAEQVLGCGFRVLFVTDLEEPQFLGRYGHVVEVVRTFGAEGFSMPPADYVAERIEIIRKHYNASWLMGVGPDGLSAEQRSLLRKFGY